MPIGRKFTGFIRYLEFKVQLYYFLLLETGIR
jgi:hypothetical protein